MKKKILIFGITGLLGNKLFETLVSKKEYILQGTCRKKNFKLIPKKLRKHTIIINDYKNVDQLNSIIKKLKPNIVINCVGIIKQSQQIKNKRNTIFINSIFPHILSLLCSLNGSKLIHFSTDCVFLGTKGNYRENSKLDANDFYGLSKINGEVKNKHTITFRTSIVGRELRSKNSLLEWFLSQTGPINGFSNAIFSGLPVKEIANVIEKIISYKKNLYGIYHLSSKPINKYELLKLFNIKFKKKLTIINNDKVKVNRTLNSNKLARNLKYKPKSWNKLIKLV